MRHSFWIGLIAALLLLAGCEKKNVYNFEGTWVPTPCEVTDKQLEVHLALSELRKHDLLLIKRGEEDFFTGVPDFRGVFQADASRYRGQKQRFENWPSDEGVVDDQGQLHLHTTKRGSEGVQMSTETLEMNLVLRPINDRTVQVTEWEILALNPATDSVSQRVDYRAEQLEAVTEWAQPGNQQLCMARRDAYTDAIQARAESQCRAAADNTVAITRSADPSQLPPSIASMSDEQMVEEGEKFVKYCLRGWPENAVEIACTIAAKDVPSMVMCKQRNQ